MFKKSFILSNKNRYKVFEKPEEKIRQKFLISNKNEKEKISKIIKKDNIKNIIDKKENNTANLSNKKDQISINHAKIIDNKTNNSNNSNNTDNINKSTFDLAKQNIKKGIINKGFKDKKENNTNIIKNKQFIKNNNYKFNKEAKLKKIKSDFKSKYEKVVCYFSDSGVKNIVMRDVANGFNVNPEPINITPCNGLNVTIGILRGSEKLIKNCILNKKDFLYIDHAYFMRGHNRGYQSYYRTILNDLHCNYIDENSTDNRLKMFNVKPKNWKKDGSLILICPPTDAIINFYEEENWLDNILKDLRKYTDRPFKIKFKKVSENKKKYKVGENTILKQINKSWREKYKNFVCDGPIEEDYKKAWCLITFSSTVALDAILNGIPVICGKECCAYPVAQHSLDKIEDPIYPDIYKWLCTLANHQFSREEMASGYAWKFLGL